MVRLKRTEKFEIRNLHSLVMFQKNVVVNWWEVSRRKVSNKDKSHTIRNLLQIPSESERNQIKTPDKMFIWKLPELNSCGIL